jgi:Holliday junction resolvase RusA-like endonuclease
MKKTEKALYPTFGRQRWSFAIPGRLPGLNDIIRSARGNRYGAAKEKKNAERVIAHFARKLPEIAVPVRVSIRWIEVDRRRDLDNIAGGGTKMILDALVKLRRIAADSRTCVRGISHEFPDPCRDYPRIEVTLEEAEGRNP